MSNEEKLLTVLDFKSLKALNWIDEIRRELFGLNNSKGARC